MRYRRAVEVGNHAYLISNKLEMVPETIEALMLKGMKDPSLSPHSSSLSKEDLIEFVKIYKN